MGKRIQINKKTRFEVFKRDKFTCQYCGRMAPDVILEVDHIKPVAEGGENDILNLITSCRDCNRGKGREPLSENDALKKQKKALAELAERREQTEMLLEWKTELLRFQNSQEELIEKYIEELTGYELYTPGKQDVKKLLKQFEVGEILEALEISFDRYFEGDGRTFDYAIKKVGGVCYNRRKQRDGEV